jgi:hypothetical protein
MKITSQHHQLPKSRMMELYQPSPPPIRLDGVVLHYNFIYVHNMACQRMCYHFLQKPLGSSERVSPSLGEKAVTLTLIITIPNVWNADVRKQVMHTVRRSQDPHITMIFDSAQFSRSAWAAWDIASVRH